ncbi:MAG: response regulator [Myxococcales bacterium]
MRKVTRDHFDLARIDINMPLMDGLKLISPIRGEQSLQRMPICVITNEGANEDRERAMSLGATSISPSRSKRAGCGPSRRRSFKIES